MAVVEGAGYGAAVDVGRRGASALEGPALDLLVVAVFAIPFAVRYPVVASIASLAAFGLAHTFLELRWVLARFRGFIGGPFLAAVCVPATVIAVNRLTGGAKAVEILAGFSLLALAVGQGVRTGRLTPAPATLAAGALVLGLVAALRTPGMYGVVIAHLHNTVTGVLLWEWSSDWAEDARRRFRTGLAVCFAAVPALVLMGAADVLLPDALGSSGPANMLVKGVSPTSWIDTTMGIRVVAVFTFLQLVHYGVWCWLLPRRAPAKAAPTTAATRTGWIAATLVATGLLALVFATDYGTGRTVYTSLATYHAYLEFPVVLVLLGGTRVSR